MQFSFDGCGSRLTVHFFDLSSDINNLEKQARDTVSAFENKYSRFIKGNFLNRLNEKKQAPAPQELVSMLLLSKKVSSLTAGYYDITVLPILENRGYGISENILDEHLGYENIEIKNDMIYLHNNISVELGSLGKGYLVDVLYKIFEKYSDNFIINFGGDIRVKGKHVMSLEDPIHPGNIIGEIEIEDMALAASGSKKRQFNGYDHLVKIPEKISNKRSDHFPLGVFTLHRKAIFADIFSTALSVSPSYIGERILRQTQGLSAKIFLTNGKSLTSKSFKANIYKNLGYNQ